MTLTGSRPSALQQEHNQSYCGIFQPHQFNQPMLKRLLGVEDDGFSAKEEFHETVFCHRRAWI